jgi:hypothetical protein
MKAVPYIDRLAQTQWFERFGFVAVAIAGCIGIVLGKLLGVPALAVTGGAVAIMLLYAAVMWRAMAGRIRADQAGDNLYYLGLLYTLSGLAYAIFTFRPENSSNSIVEGFGIALATTIFGLMLRVFFNQVRADLVEIEERARMDLAQAALELKAELNQIVVEMNDFGRQTRQSLAEAVRGVEAGMVNSVKQAGDGLAKLSVKAEEKVSKAFSQLDACADELVGSTQEASAAIADNAVKVRDLSETLASATAKLAAFAEASESTRETAAHLVEQIETARTIQAAVAETGGELRTQAETVAELLMQMRATVESSSAAQDARLRELQAAPAFAAESISKMMAELQQRMQAELSTMAAVNAEAIQGQLSALRDAVTTLREYNGGLAGELEKSRGYVSSVHGSLVNMVDELTRQVTS